MRICLVSDDPIATSAMQASCPPPHEIAVFPAQGIVNQQNTLGEHGREIVAATAERDLLLISWDLNQAPVINTLCYHTRRMLTAPVFALCRRSQDEQIAAIAAGADDALFFPVYAAVLQAKLLSYRRLVNAALEASSTGARAVASSGQILAFDVLLLDRVTHRITIDGAPVDLTPREFALLDFLIEHQETACTRDRILQHVWGLNFDTGTNLVDVYMHFLRRKLEAHGLKGMIKTIRGYGYKLVAPTGSS